MFNSSLDLATKYVSYADIDKRGLVACLKRIKYTIQNENDYVSISVVVRPEQFSKTDILSFSAKSYSFFLWIVLIRAYLCSFFVCG